MTVQYLLFAALVLQLFAYSTQAQLPEFTDVDRYVQAEDPAYRWKIASSRQIDGGRVVVVDMVSQQWLSDTEVDRTEWQHWLTLVIPDKPVSDIGFLFISGGRNGGEAPTELPGQVAQIAKATGTVVAELKMVPNQPLVFHNDSQARSEDDLIGYTWDQYLETGKSNWLARNAMVKSAVRAMDTMTAVTQELVEGHQLDRFVVAGASKRGWTTWLTGAIDERVVGIVPIVIDVLNTDQSMRHHFAAYGFWAPAIGNYVEHSIMQRMDDPRMKSLYELVDPYCYRHRLTMPKLILNAAGDQFFLPDSSQFYWDDLQGEKHLRYVPNADHGLTGTDALETVIAFYSLIAQAKPRPEFTWKHAANGSIVVQPKDLPQQVKLWSASNPLARDFRVETFGRNFTSSVLEADSDGNYAAKVDSPSEGWTAYFIELTYDVGAPVPLKLTTDVRVTPEVLPYQDRRPNGMPCVTLRCVFDSEDKAREVLTDAATQVQAKLSIEDLMSIQAGSICYLNWVPKDFDAEGQQVMGWLEQQQCRSISIQLESGRIITQTDTPIVH